MPDEAGGGSRSAVAAVLLAAGSSRRFGPDNKLLCHVAGCPLIARVATQLLASRVGEVVVVTGPDRERVGRALAGIAVRFAHNPEHECGMGSSIAVGIAALGPRVRGALICPGDLPQLGPRLIDPLVAAFEQSGGQAIVHPVLADGRQVNPVLWPRRLFPRLAALRGAEGGKPLLTALASDVVRIPALTAEDVFDIDTVADLERYRAGSARA
jgi:molybdenum cofactor cytidylyltransferase